MVVVFAVYARKTLKQKCKKENKKKCEMQESVRRGVRVEKEERKKREGLQDAHVLLLFLFLLLLVGKVLVVLSEIMSWQGQLQVFTGGDN